ncbi:HPP family protein [Xylariaceae sp. FL0255]|nr:HPP family protein [Xylariaceae sp. FL0255]
MTSFFQLSFDLDAYLDRFIPPPPWHFIPYPISYFLGHRRRLPKGGQYGNLVLTLRALLGAFISLVLIQLANHQVFNVAAKGPMIIGSFGAAAVLEFFATDSPFAQPRNMLVSQSFASIIGVAFCKLFQQAPNGDSYYVRAIAGSLACAITSVVMSLTKTIHPPAGATALVAVVDPQVVQLGWNYIPFILLACGVVLLTTLLVNNVLGRFPLYWWTASTLGGESQTSTRKQLLTTSTISDVERADEHVRNVEIILRRMQVVIPDDVELTAEETLILDKISKKL